MKAFVAAIVLSLTAATAFAQAPVGDWTAVFTGPMMERPKPLWKIKFSVAYSPAGFVISAHGLGWPSDLTVSDVKVDGARLSFTGIGSTGSTMCMYGHCETSCCPKLVFEGTINGDTMALALRWGSTSNSVEGKLYPMQAMRLWPDPVRDRAIQEPLRNFFAGSMTSEQLETTLRAYMREFDEKPYRVAAAPFDLAAVPQDRVIEYLRVVGRISGADLESFGRRELSLDVTARRLAPLILMFHGYGFDAPAGADEAERDRFRNLMDEVGDYAN